MTVPVLRQGRLLVVSIPASATDQHLRDLLDKIADEVGRANANGVVIDVSGLDVLDSFATWLLESIGRVTSLRGARTVIVGIQPGVAMAMVGLGLTLETVATARDLEDGIRYLRERSDHEERDGHDGA